MLRLVFGAAILAASSLSVLPAAAQTCTYVDIARAQDGIGKMGDASAKDEAMREAAMAQRSMARSNRRDCVGHLQRLDEISRQQTGGP